MEITAIIIAKDEEKMIGDCLKSLDWVNEILVIDGGSTDRTVSIAKKYHARIISFKSKSFSERRNKGIKEVKTDWAFYIDADERSTKELESEIKRSITELDYTAYAVPRRNFIFGREFKHCGQWPDYQKRLFKVETFEKWTGELHESANYKGELGYLKNPLLHIKHETLSEMVEKTNDWSEVEAKLMFKAHHPPMNIMRFLTSMFREFWLRMIRQAAFLDGGEGIIYANYQVFSRFVSYAKLWEMQIKA